MSDGGKQIFLQSLRRRKAMEQKQQDPVKLLERARRMRLPLIYKSTQSALSKSNVPSNDPGWFDEELYKELSGKSQAETSELAAKSKSHKDIKPLLEPYNDHPTADWNYIDEQYFESMKFLGRRPEHVNKSHKNSQANNHKAVKATGHEPFDKDQFETQSSEEMVAIASDIQVTTLGSPTYQTHSVKTSNYTDNLGVDVESNESKISTQKDISKETSFGLVRDYEGRVPYPLEQLQREKDELNFFDQMIVGADTESTFKEQMKFLNEHAKSTTNQLTDENNRSYSPFEDVLKEKGELNYFDQILIGETSNIVQSESNSKNLSDTERNQIQRNKGKRVIGTTIADRPVVDHKVAETKSNTRRKSKHEDKKVSSLPLVNTELVHDQLSSDQAVFLPENELSRTPVNKGQTQLHVDHKEKNSEKMRKDDLVQSQLSRWKRSVHSFNKLMLDLDKEPAYSVIDYLIENIVFQDENLVCINKPYRLACQGGPGIHHSISKYCTELGNRLKLDDRLYICHRLDRDTTGTILLAKSAEQATRIKTMFESRRVDKTYLAITRGVPSPYSGSINIPIDIDGKIQNTYRSILVPPDTKSMKKSIFSAQTLYEVVKKSSSAALVELVPTTGRTHQLRVHLADALGTPVLGDHKYSHRDRLAPQKLPSEILQAFKLPQSKARHIPMHLHSKQLVLKGYYSQDKPLTLYAKLPLYFNRTMKILRLAKL